MRRPVAIDIRPPDKTMTLNHIAHPTQIVDETISTVCCRRLRSGLGDEFRFRRPGDIGEQIGIGSSAGAVGGGADKEADVVVEDGEGYVVDNVVARVKGSGLAADGVVDEGSVGGPSGDNGADVAIGGWVSGKIESRWVEGGGVCVCEEVGGDFVFDPHEVVD